MKDMLYYIQSERQLYENILEQHQMLLDCVLSNKKQSYKSIVIFATGSSSNAAFAAQPYMIARLGIPVSIEEPSTAANYMLTLQADTLYIAISQGGHSYSTIEMVKRVQKMGGQIYTMTSDEMSPITQISEHVISMGMAIEEMPYVTAGYSATILLLILLALELSSITGKLTETDYQKDIQDIKVIIQNIPMIIEQSKEWVMQYLPEFEVVQRVVFIGYGGVYGVAREGETKITETVRITAFGKEVEEYMHGPYIGLHVTDHVIFIEPNGKLENRSSKLHLFLKNKVARILTISNKNRAGAENLNFDIGVNELLTPLFMTIPIHLLAYFTSKEKHIDLTKSAFSDFDQITNSKI